MGGLSVESDTGQIYEAFLTFRSSDSKWLLEMLTDAPTLPICAAVFHLDLSPLTKILYDTGVLPSQYASWEDFEEATWQPPGDVIACIDQLIQALDADPTSFAQLEARRQQRGLAFLNQSGFLDEEFEQRFFQTELADLKALMMYASNDGATAIRITGT